MFSKALLLLAVCFQVLRTGNSMYYVRQRCPWQIGESVNLNIRGDKRYPTCKVWLKEEQDGKGDTGDLLLVSVITMGTVYYNGVDAILVVNTKINGKWQNEKRIELGFLQYPLIEDIMAEEEGFKIKIQGKEYFREYEFPLENIKYIIVECPYETTFTVRDTWSNE